MPGVGFGGGAFGSTLVRVRDEGTGLNQRSNINFVGSGVTATDDPTSGETDVTIPGVAGSQSVTRRTVVPPYSVVADDHVLHVNGAGTVTLSPATDGRVLRIKRVTAAGDVVLSPSSGTIDAAASLTLSGQNQSVDLVGDGTNWSTH